MNSFAIASIVFVCSFGAALIGMLLHVRLGETHLDTDSKDVIKLVMGLIGTMAALILGLLTASANSTYNAQGTELQSLSANVVVIDRLLLLYGPEASSARWQLREAVKAAHDRIWSPTGLRPANLNAANVFYQQLHKLPSKDEGSRSLQDRALKVADSILQTRLLMSEQLGGSLPWPFLTVLIFWISALFLGFGLFARFNATVTLALFLGALSVSGSVFLISELNDPYRGIMKISDAPLLHALAQMQGKT